MDAVEPERLHRKRQHWDWTLGGYLGWLYGPLDPPERRHKAKARCIDHEGEKER